ncbi:ATP-binding protein [Streptomyces violaceorubidus]
MPRLPHPCDHLCHAESRSTPVLEPRPPRKLYRSSDGRWLGGVARGLAGHLGLPVIWVRFAFVGLFMADGLGALLYAAFWFFVPLGVGGVEAQKPPPLVTAEAGPDGRRRLVARKPDKGQMVALLLMVVVALVFVGNVDLGGGAKAYLWPTVLVGAGVALVWRQAERAPGPLGRGGCHRRTVTLLRSVAGVLLVTAGVTGIFVLQGSAAHLGSVLQAALAVLVGITLLAGPYLVRMTQDLSEERLMRIRAQERAEVAAHVHDSVLHTLTLIQRNAENGARCAAWPGPRSGTCAPGSTNRRATARTRTTSPPPSPRQ